MFHETVVMEGHLIDSDVLRRAFNAIVEEGGAFEILEFKVGRTNDDPTRAVLEVKDEGPARASTGSSSTCATSGRPPRAATRGGRPRRRTASCPTTSTPPRISTPWCASRGAGCEARARRWTAPWFAAAGLPTCVKQRLVVKGELVALRGLGIRVKPPERSRDYSMFGFMSNDISAEINKGIAISAPRGR